MPTMDQRDLGRARKVASEQFEAGHQFPHHQKYGGKRIATVEMNSLLGQEECSSPLGFRDDAGCHVGLEGRVGRLTGRPICHCTDTGPG